MGPASAAARWTDKEHYILVQTTNKQIELETKDPSREISWTRHWQQVSIALEEHGYMRTAGACQLHWKRTIDSQVATEEAAGTRWDDSEHQILMGMTEDQLALENANPASTIPWVQHWKNVSQKLKLSGYNRTVEACAAYWTLVENSSFATSGSETDDDDDSPEADDPGIDHETEGDSPAISEPQPEPQPWTDEEHECLTRLLNTHRQFVEPKSEGDLYDEKLWNVISMFHRQRGFSRSLEDCRTYWQETGRLRSPLEDRPKSASAGAEKVPIEPSPSNRSAMWSPVNVLEDEHTATEQRASEERPSAKSPTVMPQAQMFALDNQQSSSVSNIPEKSFSQFEASGFGPNHMQDERSTADRPKEKQRRHRFTQKEKAFLEAEALQNGSSPALERRLELARQLGAEEKTIRNWFMGYRRESRRMQEEITHRNLVISNLGDMDYSLTTEHSSSLPEQRSKRMHGSDDRDSMQEGRPLDAQLSKKPRLESAPFPVNEEQQPAEMNINHPNITVPIPSNTVQSTSPQEIATTTNREAPMMGNTNLMDAAYMPGQRPLAIREPNTTSHKFQEAAPMSMDKPLPSNESATDAQPTSVYPPTQHFESTQSSRATTRDIEPTIPNPTPPIENISLPTTEPTNFISSSNSVTPQPTTHSSTPIMTRRTSSTPHLPSTARTTPATPTTAPLPIPSDDASEKAWALARLATFESEINQLEQDTAQRNQNVTQISQEIVSTESDVQRMEKQEEDEIAGAIKAIRERYHLERTNKWERVRFLNDSMNSEVESVKRNEEAVKRKKTGMAGVRALVAYHDGV